MTYFITGFVYLINIFNSFRKKYSSVLLCLMIAIIWILMGANTKNPDYESYIIYYYNLGGVKALDLGYMYLNRIFLSLGFEYTTFRMFFSLVGILLIQKTVKKFTINNSGFYILYFIYPFMLDAVQVRNFFIMAILIYSFPFLISGTRKDMFKYIILILIASTIQISALIYLPLCVIGKVRKNALWRTILIFMIVAGVLLGSNRTLLANITELMLHQLKSYDSRIEIYGDIQTKFGFLLYWFIQIVNFILILWTKQIMLTGYKTNGGLSIKNQSIGTELKYVETSESKLVLLIFWINVYAFLFLPLYVFQATFSRFMRNIIPLNYIAYCIVYNMIPKKNLEKFVYPLMIIIYTIFLFYIEIYHPFSTSIVHPIFESNWFFN